jgi:biofilm PGA synthesis N-glycosyltransferase PgaC
VLIIILIAGGLLLLTWGIYPLVMRGLASGRTEEVSVPPATWPTVTAVVATREEPPLVESRIRDLLAADYPADRLTVVVAIDAAHGGDPRTYPMTLPGVTVVPGEAAGGKAATLNAAVQAATGDILVFTDTHQRFDAGAIRLLVEELVCGPYDVVSGQLDLPEGRRRSLVEHYWRLERRLRADEAKVASAIGVSGSIYAMPRELWAPLPAGLILDDL